MVDLGPTLSHDPPLEESSMQWFRPFALLSILLASLGCSDSNPAGAGRTSTVALLLTDAPDDLAHAWVVVREVYLQGSPDDEEEGGRVVVYSGPSAVIDLLELADDFLELTEVDVPAGEYGQLRLVLDGAAIETEAGAVFATAGFPVPGGGEPDGALNCPSCAQTGIKVLLQGRDLSIDAAFETLLMDFEVSESFAKPAGQSGMWMLQPVVRLFDDPGDVE
jgi:hypothetical protein